MAYDQAVYKALRTLEVPRNVALALADASSPVKVITPQTKPADLVTGTATTAQIATQVNALTALLVTAGVLK